MSHGHRRVYVRRSQFALPAGLALSGALYGLILYGPLGGGLVERYTTGHPIEIATVILFFWGLCDLTLRWSRLRRERHALAHAWLDRPQGPTHPAAATETRRKLESLVDRFGSTWLSDRLLAGLEFVGEKGSAEGLHEHLQYLAEADAARAQGAFALVRVQAWMIPILGFLGTVIGITMAIANVTPSQLESSLGEVTGGLAVAFDTTALSLALSMVLMFALFLVERSTQNVLDAVEQRAHRELAYRFRSGAPETTALYAALETSSQSILAHTESLVRQQLDLWSSAIARLQQQHEESLRSHETRLQQALAGLQGGWREQASRLEQTTAQVAQLERESSRLLDAFTNVIKGQGQVATVQRTLADNLLLLQQTQKLEDVLHSLAAALHLLTARHGLPPVRDGRAA